jgi:hypothetical protein
MNHAASYADCIDFEAEMHAKNEIRFVAIHSRINSDPEKIADAISEYYDDFRVSVDGHDLLTEFTIALAGAENLMDAIAHGDALPDSELQAFRALCRQIAEAKRRTSVAVDEAVMAEMLA